MGLLTLSLRQFYKQRGFLRDFQRNILFCWLRWLKAGHCQLGLSLNDLGVNSTSLGVDYEAAFLPPKDPENNAIALVVCFQSVNKTFAIVHSNVAIFAGD